MIREDNTVKLRIKDCIPYKKCGYCRFICNIRIQYFVPVSEWKPGRTILLPYIKNPNRIPAATAEPITPATFGPIACINR